MADRFDEMAKNLLTERYKTCGDQWDAIATALRAEREAGFAAGQEAMRDIIANSLDEAELPAMAKVIRSLPLTPEKES